MPVIDPIADLLTRIRNGIMAKKKKVSVPASNIKREIVRVLLKEGYIAHYEFEEDNKQGVIHIYLKYDEQGTPAITALKRVSKPGVRVYVRRKEIPKVVNGLGIAILSTPKGILTDAEARKLKVGGEVLCYVW